MSMVLPNVLNYNESMPTLPDSTKKVSIVITPSNSQASFTQGQLIQFDLPQQGFLVPDSLSIRYKMSVTSTPNTNGVGYFLCGTPVYAPFQREEIIINSNVCETINNYNQVHNMMNNLTKSVSDKFGLAPSYGYSNGESNGVAPTMEQLDGRISYGTAGQASSEYFFMSAPFPCLLSYSKKLIPLHFMGSTRIQLTLDSISNIFSVGSDTLTNPAAIPLPTAYSISNIELCYDQMEFSNDVNEIVRKNERIYLKSQSFSNVQQTLTPSSGNLNLIFNTRLASIKSAFLNMSSTDAAKCVNKLFDSVDISKGNGTYQISVGGYNHPQRSLSTSDNKAGIFTALRDALDPIFEKSNSLAISRTEWNFTDSSTTSIITPGKFYVGFNLEKMHSNNL